MWSRFAMLMNDATEIPGGAVKLSSFPRSEVSHRTVFIYSGAKRAPRGSGPFQATFFSLPTEFEVTAYGGDFGVTTAIKLEAGPMWSTEIPESMLNSPPFSLLRVHKWMVLLARTTLSEFGSVVQDDSS